MAVYFTADTHFGHKSILRLCERPFASLQAMDEALVARWNERVGPDDLVYHLGDFCFKGSALATQVGAEAWLVLTGITRREDLGGAPPVPTRVLASLEEALER